MEVEETKIREKKQEKIGKGTGRKEEKRQRDVEGRQERKHSGEKLY